MVDMSEDNFFSLIGDDFVTRDDLKLTDNCNPNTAEAVRELLKTAEANGERLVVRISSVIRLLLNRQLIFATHKCGVVMHSVARVCVSVSCLSVSLCQSLNF